MTRYAAIVLLAMLATGCRDEAAQAPEPIRPVVVTVVKPVATAVFGPFASTVEARYQTQLGFQLAGRMVARDVYVGDVVKAGMRLAALDPTVTQFALTRAQADVADAKAQLLNTEGVESRQRQLATAGNASQATLDNAVASRDTARARLDQMQAALRMAQDQIGYTQLRASFDGVVTAWSAEVGQYVSNGQAVVTVARPDIREAVVDIPDELIGKISPATIFTVHLLSSPDIMATASVREIGPLADAATRSRRVRLALQNPSDAFRIGTTLTVEVRTPISPRVVLPATAVLDDAGHCSVWVLADDGRSVTRRAVAVGGGEGDEVFVTGLADGDRVVTVGVHSLKDGQAVAGEVGRGVAKGETRL